MVVAFIYILYIVCNKNCVRIFRNALKSINLETGFDNTYYIIYDNSTETICNRLIVIQPFLWFVWCKYNSIVVLNSNPNECSATEVHGIVIDDDQVTYDKYKFTETCLPIDLSSLLLIYSKYDTYKINYNIEDIWTIDNTCTILDMINDLLRRELIITK